MSNDKLTIRVSWRKYDFEGRLLGESSIETVETSQGDVKRAVEVVSQMYQGNTPTGYVALDNYLKGDWLMLTIRPQRRGAGLRRLYNALLYASYRVFCLTTEFVLEIDEAANTVDYYIPITESVTDALGCV